MGRIDIRLEESWISPHVGIFLVPGFQLGYMQMVRIINLWGKQVHDTMSWMGFRWALLILEDVRKTQEVLFETDRTLTLNLFCGYNICICIPTDDHILQPLYNHTDICIYIYMYIPCFWTSNTMWILGILYELIAQKSNISFLYTYISIYIYIILICIFIYTYINIYIHIY